MQIAIKTLDAIAKAMEADQGGKYRGLLRKLLPTAEDAYREEDGGFRSHLGASMIGRECAREIWYGFHWTTKPQHEARILRFFNRGHLEEPRMVACLMLIGCEVWQFQPDGSQFRISDHGGHYSGSLDGVVRGIPDLPPGTPCLTEFKTHNDKSFQKLKANGVLNSKWEHFVQMQQYMGKNGLRHALYMACNKNDDEIHAELVDFDPVQYTKYLNRAGDIVANIDPPPRINNSPGFYKCKFCNFSPVCHGDALPEQNCRTCFHSNASMDGNWHCNIPVQPDGGGAGDLIGKEKQLVGCGQYTLRPSIKAK